MQQNVQFQQAQAAAANLFRKVWGNFLNIIKKPVTTGRDIIVEADVKMAATFIVLQGLFSAIFALIVSSKLGSLGSSLMSSFTSGLGGLLGGGYSYEIEMPYAKIFFVVLLSSIVFSCILAAFLLLGQMALKNQASYQQMLSAVAIRSALIIPTTIVSMIVALINPGYGLGLFYIGGVWGFVALSQAMTSYRTDEEKNKHVAMISVVTLVFVIVALFLMSKLAGLCMPETSGLW